MYNLKLSIAAYTKRFFIFTHLQFYFRNFFFTRGDFNFNWLWLIKLIWWNRTRPKPFGNLGIGISASASALTSASASALQKKFCLAKFLFCLSKFLIKKKSMVKSFSSTLVHHPGSFSRCLGESFCRNQVSTCFWRKELTVDVYGGLEVP